MFIFSFYNYNCFLNEQPYVKVADGLKFNILCILLIIFTSELRVFIVILVVKFSLSKTYLSFWF